MYSVPVRAIAISAVQTYIIVSDTSEIRKRTKREKKKKKKRRDRKGLREYERGRREESERFVKASSTLTCKEQGMYMEEC